MLLTRHILPCLGFLLACTRADLATVPSGDGCVDPSGLAACVQQADGVIDSCVSNCDRSSSDYSQCVTGCGIAQHEEYIACFVQSCWNQVYTCHYQVRVIDYTAAAQSLVTSVEAPFFPTPDGVDGACSCNLGIAYLRLSALPGLNTCDNTNVDTVGYCNCCNTVTALSNALSTCPDSDLANINIASAIQSVASSEQATGIDCSPILNSNMCATEFGIELVAGTEFYDARALPPGVPGPNTEADVGTFTTFPGPQVTTVSMLAVTTVITLAPWNDDSGSTAGTATGGAQATGSEGGAQSTGSEGGSASSAASGPAGSIVLFGLLAGMSACAWL